MTTKPSEPELCAARKRAADLERDVSELAAMVERAREALREARERDDADARRQVAADLATLRAAHAEALADVDAARTELSHLEAAAARASAEAELAHATRRSLRLRADALAELRQGLDAALGHVAAAARCERDAAAAHRRAAELQVSLGLAAARRKDGSGLPTVPAYRPVTVADAMGDDDAVAEDAPLVAALVAAVHAHPVGRGRERAELAAEREATASERRARAEAQRDAEVWYARRHLADRAERGGIKDPDELVRAEAAREWIRRHPEPPEVPA
jgi:hypothetical protein